MKARLFTNKHNRSIFNSKQSRKLTRGRNVEEALAQKVICENSKDFRRKREKEPNRNKKSISEHNLIDFYPNL